MLKAMYIPVISLVFLSQLVVEIWADCGEADDSGWYIHESKCYFISLEKTQTFSKSREACQGMDAELASMPDEMAWSMTSSKTKNSTQYWIGLSTDNPSSSSDIEDRRSAWKWMDGSVYSTSWNKWYNEEKLPGGTTKSAEPGKNEMCAFFESGYWFGRVCDYPFHYICSKPYTQTTSVAPPTLDTPAVDSGNYLPMIIGVVVAVVVVAVIVVVVVIVVIKRKQQQQQVQRRENGGPVERGKSLIGYTQTIVEGDVVIKPLDLEHEA